MSPHHQTFQFLVVAMAGWINQQQRDIFSLSFRDVEDLLAHRGITVTQETIRQ